MRRSGNEGVARSVGPTNRTQGVIMRILRAVLSVLAVALALPATASFHTFAIQQLYSNADGSIQFIVLKEAAGENGQQFLTGHAITSTQGGTQHKFTFPNDLPGNNTANHSFL